MSNQFPVATATSTEVVVAAPTIAGAIDAPEQLTGLQQFWQTVQRWKWVIIGIVLASLMTGFVLTSMMPREFTATARLDISREPEQATTLDREQRAPAVDNAEFYKTQYSLLHARSLAARVGNALRLSKNSDFVSSFRLRQGKGIKPPSARSIVSALLGATRINPVVGSSLVDIEVTTHDPDLSAQIANEWGKQFIQASLEKRFQSTADARRFLEGRLNELRQRMDDSERELVTYSSNAGIIALSQSDGDLGTPRTQQTLVGQNLLALDAALTAATAERIAAQSRISKNGALSLAANQSLLGLRQQRAEIASNYAKVITQFEPNYPTAQALQSQLNTLDQTISREEARIREGVNAEYRQAQQRESELRAQVDSLKAKIVAEQRGTIRSNVLQRDVDTNRQLYDALLQRYKEIGIKGVGPNSITIVDPAEPAAVPSSPDLLRNLIVSLLIGIAVAIATIFALFHVGEGIDSPAAVAEHLAQPLLGVIPSTHGVDPHAEAENQRSTVAEAYIGLLTNLSFSTDHGVPRTMAITSTRAGEGKTSMACALGRLLARSGRRVLIIDGDMQAPTLHKLFGVENTQGLSNLLAGADAWEQIVKPSGLEGLTILTAGPRPPSAAALLRGPRFATIIHGFSDLFDHVLIDTPSVLGRADGLLVASVVQGVVHLVQTNGARVRGIRLALARLTTGRANVIGVVLTKADASAFDSFRYGYGDGNAYEYGSSARPGRRLIGRG